MFIFILFKTSLQKTHDVWIVSSILTFNNKYVIFIFKRSLIYVCYIFQYFIYNINNYIIRFGLLLKYTKYTHIINIYIYIYIYIYTYTYNYIIIFIYIYNYLYLYRCDAIYYTSLGGYSYNQGRYSLYL